MPTADALKIVLGTSSFLGLAGLICYLYFTIQIRRVENSVRGLVEGERLFNAEQVLKILSQFQDDNLRLIALEKLTGYDVAKAEALLKKVKSKVDLEFFAQSSSRHYRQWSGTTAVFFLVIATMGLIYSTNSDRIPRPVPVATPTPSPSPTLNLKLVSPKNNEAVLAHGNKKGDAWIEVKGSLDNIPAEADLRVYVFYQSADKNAEGWWYYKDCEVNKNGEWFAPHLYLGGDDKVVAGNTYRIQVIAASAEYANDLKNLSDKKPLPNLDPFHAKASSVVTISISIVIPESTQ